MRLQDFLLTILGRFGTQSWNLELLNARIPGYVEISCLRMVGDKRRRRLFRFELELIAQLQADPCRVEQLEQLGLIFQVRTGGVSERVAAAAVVLLEELSDARRIVAGDSPFAAKLPMERFGEALRHFYAKPVQVKVIQVAIGVEELLGAPANLVAHRHAE